MLIPQECAARLEQMEANKASISDLAATLDPVHEPECLWAIADSVVPYVPIMRAVYRRAEEIGASLETASGYLATAYVFDGDIETASAITRNANKFSADAVLLDAWVLTAPTSDAALKRLNTALLLCPTELRLWRQLANQSLRAGDRARSREAYTWLAQHEPDPDEQRRIAEILRGNRW